MNRLPRLAIRRPVTTSMVFLSLAVFGLIATRLLPLEFFPDVDFPGMMVEIPYPGSSPEEVEQLIARPVEEALATMDGIQRMITNVGQDNVNLIVFFDWDADMDARGVEAMDKIDGIRHRLPDDVDRVFVRRFTSANEPILGLRIGSNRDLSDAWELLDRNVRRRLERVEGVASVQIDGVEPREVRILLHADRVAAHGIDINALRERLRGANFSVSAGYVDDAQAGRRIRVTPMGTFSDIDEIRRLPVNERGLRLGDIAEVSVESPPRRYERLLDGQFAVGVNIFSESGANLVEVSRAVLKEVDAINKLAEMEGVNLFVLFSQAEGVVQSLKDLALAGLIGALMSMVVLYVFLRQWATTLIVMLSVPTAILITLGAMYFLGMSLNILSMMGLMLAVGMLVDNAVVVTESIYRCRQRFPDQPGKATLVGVREVAMAVTAGTLTTVIVFLPNIFGAQNEITSFLSFVAYAITIALIASLLIAQTIIPLLTLKVPAPPPPKSGGWLNRLTNAYASVLDFSLRRRWIAALAVIVLLASAVVPLGQVKTNMFQQAEGDRLMLHYNVEGTYSLERVRRDVDRIEHYLRENKDRLGFDSLYSYYSEDRAETTLILDSEREISNELIRERVREQLPATALGRPSFERQGGNGGGSDAISLTLHGESSERLFELSEECRARALQRGWSGGRPLGRFIRNGRGPGPRRSPARHSSRPVERAGRPGHCRGYARRAAERIPRARRRTDHAAGLPRRRSPERGAAGKPAVGQRSRRTHSPGHGGRVRKGERPDQCLPAQPPHQPEREHEPRGPPDGRGPRVHQRPDGAGCPAARLRLELRPGFRARERCHEPDGLQHAAGGCPDFHRDGRAVRVDAFSRLDHHLDHLFVHRRVLVLLHYRHRDVAHGDDRHAGVDGHRG